MVKVLRDYESELLLEASAVLRVIHSRGYVDYAAPSSDNLDELADELKYIVDLYSQCEEKVD